MEIPLINLIWQCAHKRDKFTHNMSHEPDDAINYNYDYGYKRRVSANTRRVELKQAFVKAERELSLLRLADRSWP